MLGLAMTKPPIRKMPSMAREPMALATTMFLASAPIMRKRLTDQECMRKHTTRNIKNLQDAMAWLRNQIECTREWQKEHSQATTQGGEGSSLTLISVCWRSSDCRKALVCLVFARAGLLLARQVRPAAHWSRSS